MLLSLVPNVALDRTLVMPGFRKASVVRTADVRPAAGGKGVNVARAARSLGQPVRLCGLLAGDNGRTVAALAQQEGLDAAWCWMEAGETRICTLVVDPAGDDLALNEFGPAVSGATWGTFARMARAEAARAEAVACCGSLPPGVPPEAYMRLISWLLEDGRMVLLDTSRAALQLALDLPLAILKVNGEELGDALGRTISSPAEALEAAEEVRARGPKLVVVTLGPHGALATGAAGRFHAIPPAIPIISTVGSGDALLAGLVTGLLRGQPLADALRLGVACGTVNATHIGGGMLAPNEVAALVPQVQVEILNG
jgi:1-phosphofructokinase family hexose kinase